METRVTVTLERLLAIPVESIEVALIHACDVVAGELKADKVDAFMYRAETDTLVALGTSQQPLSLLQRQHGLDRLPLANGGRAVEVFRTGKPYASADVSLDTGELRGIRETLAVRSHIAVPLESAGRRLGVILVASLRPNAWGDGDVRFASMVARWVGMLLQRAELVERLTSDAAARARRVAAEELVTLVAHDLRNHVAPLDLRLKLLLRGAEREQRLPDVADVTLALRSVARLGGLIGDILDTARLDRGVFALQLAPLDVVALVKEVCKTLSSPEHPVEAKPSLPELQVLADAMRVRGALENLVSNARQHSPEGAPVTVLVGTERHSDRELALIDVLDDGAGIPAELLPHIFERYVTSKARGGGLGLGLYVAKRIAELHGGDLRVERRNPIGTRFSLLLPLTGPRRTG